MLPELQSSDSEGEKVGRERGQHTETDDEDEDDGTNLKVKLPIWWDQNDTNELHCDSQQQKHGDNCDNLLQKLVLPSEHCPLQKVHVQKF